MIEELKKRIETKKRIVFPEGKNQKIIAVAKRLKAEDICEPILLTTNGSLEKAMEIAKNGEADAVVAGIDYTSRDVILAARSILGMASGEKTFTSSFIMDLPNGKIVTLADCATCKNPTSEQLADIAIQTRDMTSKVLGIEPKIAFLSFSTFRSGGKDESIDKIEQALEIIKSKKPEIIADGEMQLDAAIDTEIAAKKAPSSKVAGKADILITPDLNSGNILYKSIEQFGKAKAYGPILQGFGGIVSDLSRGSTEDDIYGSVLISILRAQ